MLLDSIILIIKENKGDSKMFEDEDKSLIDSYIERGKKVISEDKWELWKKILPIRVGDLYHGMEVDNALTILESYKEERDLDKVRKIFDDENHSGWSAGLVAGIIKKFSNDYKEILPALGYKVES